MRRLLSIAALAAALLCAPFAAPSAHAQGCGQGNPNCIAPTPPFGDNSNRIATTAYVIGFFGAGLPLAANNILIGSGSNLAIAAPMTGDATIAFSGGNAVLTIASHAVSYAKLQQVAAASLLGNPTGSLANAAEITLGATLAFSGSALQTGAGTGDVTWSANSFVTTLATAQSAPHTWSGINTFSNATAASSASTGAIVVSTGGIGVGGAVWATNLVADSGITAPNFIITNVGTFTNQAAPSTPVAGKTIVWTDSTDKRLHDKNDAGTIGTTVVADTGASNNFVTAISPAGVISKAQPAFSNLSGSATCAQLPALTSDVTTPAGSCTTTIAANAVTYAKFQQVAASRLLGNPTGSLANAAEISLGATLAFSGSALQTGAGTGDVTWSANSFVTTIAANVVSNAKFRQSAALSLVGNCSNATANVADVTGTANQVLVINSAGTACNFGQVNLAAAAAITGTLGAGNGGSGVASPTAHAVLLGEGSSPFGTATIGTAGRLFIDQGAAADPSFNVLSQDCTITAGGVITCLKTNNVAFTAFATQAVPCLVSQGCTGQITAQAARGSSGLNIDQITKPGDVNYSILVTDRTVAHTVMSVSRTDTLPAANAVNPGQHVLVSDIYGVASGAITVTIQRNSGSDTVNGGASALINSTRGGQDCVSDGVNSWVCNPQGSSAVSGVSTIGGLSGAVGVGGSLTASAGTVYGITQPQGRLTLVTGTPVLTSDQVNKGTIFYDCYNGNLVPYYNGTTDLAEAVSGCEVSTAMVSAASNGQVVSGQVYDVWWVHSGANRICLAMNQSGGGGGGWASDTSGSNTARGTGYSQLDTTSRPYITNKNSISFCYNGSTNYGTVSANQATYLGTTYATANGQTGMAFKPASAAGGTNNILGLYNGSNRVPITAYNQDSTSAWSITSTSFQPLDVAISSGLLNRISWIDGLQQSGVISSIYNACASGAGGGFQFGLSLDSTSATPVGIGTTTNSANSATAVAPDYFAPQIGFHFLQGVQKQLVSGTANCAGAGFEGIMITLQM